MAQPDTPIPQRLIEVRRLESHDAASYREIRLESLQSHPEAFASSWEDEAAKPASWWTERLETNTVLGGWIDGPPLLGVAGFRVHAAAKLRHKGILWGMYVRPQARGTGLAMSLVQRIIEQAKPLVEELCLGVATSNRAAHRLYSAAGFEPYGLERRALKLGEEYYDELLMALVLPHPKELPPGTSHRPAQ
jgi:RimJ/RimL family protein N-acetyltransferase